MNKTVMTVSKSTRLLVALSIGGSALSAATAQAQVSGPSSSATRATDSAGQIEDITVTAQRRTEKAQDVPISLQSFSEGALQRSGVETIEDLQSVVGGVLFQPTSTRPAIFIRGVGNNATSTTADVLTFIDGVYQPFGQSTDFGNIASVEVLKGPQGTLFGRNATGGVIQITTRPPSETPSARAEIGYGNYNTIEASGYATSGLATGLAMDISFHYSNQQDGFGRNVFNGENVFASQSSTLRSRLRYDISDTTNLTLAADYNQTRGNVGNTVAPAFGYNSVFVQGAIRSRGGFYPGDYDVNAGPLTPTAKTWEWGVSGTLETQLAALTLRNITAYRRSRERSLIDFDGGPADILDLVIARTPRTMVSEELQLLSPTSGALQWVGGIYYYRSLARVNPFSVNTIVNLNTAIDESIAPYAQATYEIFPGTRFTAGGRYTIENRSMEGFISLNGAELPGTRGKLSLKFKEPTWRFALDHKFSPDILVYGSVSRGFNSGYYNDSQFSGYANEVQAPRILPEFLTAYEIGTKTDLLDHRLRLNLSAFLYDYTGLQQQIFDQGSPTTINAGAARIKGIDFEIVAKPINSLTLSISGTYLDGKYKSYKLAPNYLRQPDGSVAAIGSLDAAGKTITNAPSMSYTMMASHVLEAPIGDFTTTATLNYRGKSFIDPNNRFPLPTRYLLNVSEQWTSVDKRLFATLWVKNLLNKRYDYAVNILTPVGLAGNPAPPRTYGASVGVQF